MRSKILKLTNRKIIIIAVILATTLVGLIFFFKSKEKIGFLQIRKQERFGDLIEKSKITPTLLPPTPTPTMTPQQIAEIRRKTLEKYNSQYGPCRYIPIIMYHHVMPASEAKSIGAGYMNVPPEIFKEQVEYLISKGYSLLRLDEMMDSLRANSLPAKPIVLTFDDAYRDFFDNVYPVLRGKNVKATLFVISQFVGGERYVNWGQVQQMANSNLVLIGDHTLSHPSLPKQTKEEEFNQIVSARKILEQQIGKEVRYFAYPYGGINKTAEEILKENGFLGAVVTTNTTPVCAGLPFELPRQRVGAVSLRSYGF